MLSSSTALAQSTSFGTVGAMETHFHQSHVALSARRERLQVANSKQGYLNVAHRSDSHSRRESKTSRDQSQHASYSPISAIPLSVGVTLASRHVAEQRLSLPLGQAFEIPSRPQCLKDIADRFGIYEDVDISFWGVWFVVAAATRLKRPITRKRNFRKEVEVRRKQKASAATAASAAKLQQALLDEVVREQEAHAAITAIEGASPATSRRSSVYSATSNIGAMLPRKIPSAQRLRQPLADLNAYTVDKEGHVSPPVPAALLQYDFSRDPKKAASRSLRDAVSESAQNVKSKKCTSMAAYKKQVVPREMRAQKVSVALRKNEPLRLRSILMHASEVAKPIVEDAGSTSAVDNSSPSRPLTSPVGVYTPRPPTVPMSFNTLNGARPGTVPHNTRIPKPPASSLSLVVKKQAQEHQDRTHLGQLLFQRDTESLVDTPGTQQEASDKIAEDQPSEKIATPTAPFAPVFLLDPDLERQNDPLTTTKEGGRPKRRSTTTSSVFGRATDDFTKPFGDIEVVMSGQFEHTGSGSQSFGRSEASSAKKMVNSRSIQGVHHLSVPFSPTAARQAMSGKEKVVNPNVFSPAHYHGGYGEAHSPSPRKHTSELLKMPSCPLENSSRAPSFSLWARAPSTSQFTASSKFCPTPSHRGSESRDTNNKSTASSSYAPPAQAYLLTKRRRVLSGTSRSENLKMKAPSMVLHEDEMDVILFPLPFRGHKGANASPRKDDKNSAFPSIGGTYSANQKEGSDLIVRYPTDPTTGNRVEVSSEWMRNARRVADKALHERLSAKMARTNATHTLMRPARQEFLLQQLRKATSLDNRRAKPLEAILNETDRFVAECRRNEDLYTVADSRRLWFTNFYEEIVDRFAFTEDVEHTLWAVQLLVQQAGGELSVGLPEITLLFEALSDAELSEVGVQFVLCHLCAAFSVPYNTFRELLEFRFIPYLLLGNGMFVYKQPRRKSQSTIQE